MTVQTEVRPSVRTAKQPIRRTRAFVLGVAAMIAAGTGIGIGVAVTGSNHRPAVVAPDSPAGAALQRLHAEGYPESTQRSEALQRLHEEGYAGVESSSFTDSFARLKDEGWRK